MNILFICTANRFRSQAARVFGEAFGLMVDSAGVGDKEFDRPIPKPVKDALVKMGYIVTDKKSKPVTLDLVKWADKVLYMIPKHGKLLSERFPKYRSKFEPLGLYIGVTRIPDLAFLSGERFLNVLRLIESCVKYLSRCKPLVIGIRGCNGSGKSTLVRKLRDHFGYERIRKSGKVWAYRLRTWPLTYVLGPYEGSHGGGGCDRFEWNKKTRKFSFISDSISKLCRKGNVLMEGSVTGTMYKQWIGLQRTLDCKFIFAVLNTPFKLCVERINKRRISMGKNPIDPEATMARNQRKLVKSLAYLQSAGMDVRALDYRKAFPIVLQWLREEGSALGGIKGLPRP